MKRRAALHNLGCKVNACETQAMRELLEQAGYEIVDFSETADVYVVNTCTVTQIADRKSRQMLHRARAKNPAAVIVAAGCYVESAGREEHFDNAVDIYLGNDEKSTLIEKIDAFTQNHRVIFSSGSISQRRSFESLPITHTNPKVRAFLKIEDGCNRFCSYCLIPYVRGRVRSLPQEEVLRQARSLIQNGCREIVLDGIHLTSYGMDFPKDETGSRTDLISLLNALDRLPDLKRIRLGSLEPDYITPETAEALSRVSKLCPHFHLSLQSGCDSILRRMNRHYTTQQFREKMHLLRSCFDTPALTTDIITGFPGETAEEAAQTEAFLEEAAFYQIHVFPYSPRSGTKAAAMPDQVPGNIKKERRDRILALTGRQQQAFETALCGRKAQVLIEEEKEIDGRIRGVGHTDRYLYAAAEGVPGELVDGMLCCEKTDTESILFVI